MAELLIRLVQATAAGLVVQPPPAGGGQLRAPLRAASLQEETLVPPMTSGNYETNASTCWLVVRTRAEAACVASLDIVRVLGSRCGLTMHACSCRAVQDAFQGLVDRAAGFEWVNERPEATERKAQKWGYVAAAPGATLEFSVDTRVPGSGGDDKQPPSARIVVSYLASYEGEES